MTPVQPRLNLCKRQSCCCTHEIDAAIAAALPFSIRCTITEAGVYPSSLLCSFPSAVLSITPSSLLCPFHQGAIASVGATVLPQRRRRLQCPPFSALSITGAIASVGRAITPQHHPCLHIILHHCVEPIMSGKKTNNKCARDKDELKATRSTVGATPNQSKKAWGAGRKKKKKNQGGKETPLSANAKAKTPISVGSDTKFLSNERLENTVKTQRRSSRINHVQILNVARGKQETLSRTTLY